MKLVAWNVETLAKRLGELPAAAEALGSPDVLCLQKVRVRAQDTADVVALERALPGYSCHHSLARDPKNVTFRGGRAYDVATFVRGALLADTGFVDIWRHLHPDERGYSWFNPRARTLDAARVDYIVISPDLVSRVASATILPRQPWSDHAPLALELKNSSE